MDSEKILQIYNGDINGIYGYMYGNPKCDKRVLFIKKNDLELSRYNDAFLYIWGFPEPDANIYLFKDYGITWAFNIDDIKGEYVYVE